MKPIKLVARIRAVAIVCFIAASAGVSAQEFDIFDRSDFLDPRIRGVAFIPDANGIRFADESPFLLSRLSLGGVSDYYMRTAPSGADVTVAHLATTYYRGRHQFNLKLTNFGAEDGSAKEIAFIPRRRATLQWAMYMATPDPAPPKTTNTPGEAPIILSRYVLSTSVEDPRGLASENAGPAAVRRRTLHRNYEFGGEMDVRIPGINVVGTLSYAYRHAVSGTSQRFAYVYRTGQKNFHRLKVDTSVGYVAQKARDWQWGNVRPAIHARLALDRASTAIHFAYAPTISVIGGVKMRHEFALFIDRALVAHVFKRPTPEDPPI
jgi:hypothetical protein